MIKTIQPTYTKIVIFLGTLYLIGHLLILLGSLKERADHPCPSAIELQNWREIAEVAGGVCITIQGDLVSELKNGYSKELEAALKDGAYWRWKYQEFLENNSTTSGEIN